MFLAAFTFNLSTPYAIFASFFLYIGELFGIFNLLLYFLQVWEVKEPPMMPVIEGRTVDVFEPTYNEDPQLLRATLEACLRMDYPHRTFVLDDGRRVSDMIPFGQYMDITLTSAHYRIGRAMTDTGEVGSFGYWLAAFQFVGFLVGGLCVYAFLLVKPVCPTCNLYLRPLSALQKTFPDADSASPYYDMLFQHPVDGPEFAALIRSEAKVTGQKGAVSVNTVLHGCPKCKSQLIEETVQVHNGSDWKDANKLNRRVAIPNGVDLLGVFRP